MSGVFVDDKPFPSYTDDEQEVMDHINAAMQGIVKLGLRRDTLNLHVELASATHGLQMFVAAHAMQRIYFVGGPNWYDDAG